jgi:hypothetical protein
MSSAFVREDEEQWLGDISPTFGALINYLTRENNGVRVYEKSVHQQAGTGKQIHLMSNGLSYAIDEDNKWYVVTDV